MFTFIGVAVTNVLASNSPGAPSISDTEKQRRIAVSQRLQSQAVFSAACCGVACTAGCALFGDRLLTLMGANPQTLPDALPYLRIRSLSAPAMMIMNSCQGAFLGQQNTLTPLTIFIVAATCNAALDVTLVLGLGWGLRGAATATAVTQVRPARRLACPRPRCGTCVDTGAARVQYIAAAAFLRALRWHGDNGRGGIRFAWSGVPTLRDLYPFFDVGWKLLTRTLFKMAAFASISSVAAQLPQKTLASHQVRTQARPCGTANRGNTSRHPDLRKHTQRELHSRAPGSRAAPARRPTVPMVELVDTVARRCLAPVPG